MEIEKIEKAFCPDCGRDILDKVSYLQTTTLHKQRVHFTSLRRLISGDDPILKLNAREQKEFDAYFAGTKISNKTVRCSHCHEDKKVTINEFTGAMTGFASESKIIPVVDSVVLVDEPEIEVVVSPPVVQKPKENADEISFLYVRRYPGVPAYCR